VTDKELITVQDYYDAIMEGTDNCVPEGWEEFAKEIIDITLMLHKKELRKSFRHVSLY
jgi:hypothetical protein